MNIGIVTWHYHNNIGSNLQAYAIQKVLQDLGYDTEFINYHSQKQSILKNKIKDILVSSNNNLPSFLRYKLNLETYAFQRRMFNCSKIVYDEFSASELVKKYDVVICGSDQIWAPTVFDPVYFLSFVPDFIPKISYAPSIGLNEIPSNLYPLYERYLKRFQSISIREFDGQTLLNNLFHISSKLVLDPTLLLNTSDWEKVCSKCNTHIPIRNNFIFCYFLGSKEWHRKFVLKYASDHNLELVMLSEYNYYEDKAKLYYSKMDPALFLKYIKSSSVVFTDSYHGTLFSILFKKNFYIFDRFDNEDKNCQNSRINTIDTLFNLKNQRINDLNFKSNFEPNYTIIYKKLNLMRQESISYLKESIEKPIFIRRKEQ